MKDAYDVEYRLYFAYGSNMNEMQINQRCQSPQVVCAARLSDYSLKFFGESKRWDGALETVVPEPGSEVWGVTYKLDFLDAEYLDAWQDVRLDGTGPYFHFPVKVEANGILYSVLLYKRDINGEARLPSTEYLQHIINGACQRNLPKDYIEKLRQNESRPASYPVPKQNKFYRAALVDRCNGCSEK